MTGPAAAFVVAVTFLAHPGSKEGSVSCPNMSCARRMIAEALADPEVARVRVWKRDEYSRLPESERSVFPPIIDLHKA